VATLQGQEIALRSSFQHCRCMVREVIVVIQLLRARFCLHLSAVRARVCLQSAVARALVYNYLLIATGEGGSDPGTGDSSIAGAWCAK
jgi:hypothetical protein